MRRLLASSGKNSQGDRLWMWCKEWNSAPNSVFNLVQLQDPGLLSALASGHAASVKLTYLIALPLVHEHSVICYLKYSFPQPKWDLQYLTSNIQFWKHLSLIFFSFRLLHLLFRLYSDSIYFILRRYLVHGQMQTNLCLQYFSFGYDSQVNLTVVCNHRCE